MFALDPCCSEEKVFFDLNRNMNITIWRRRKKKHYAWIVPWTSSQLFVPRLNEKSIPGLWIKHPILVELVSYCHSIHVLTQNKIKHKKNLIDGHFHKCRTFKKACDVNSFVEQDFKNGKQAKSLLLTPHRSSLQCSPTSQVVHHCTHAHHRESRHSASRRSSSGQSCITPALLSD